MIYFYSLSALILLHFTAQLYSSLAAPSRIARVIRDVIGVVKNAGFLYLLYSILVHVELSQQQLYQMIQMIMRSV